MNAKFKRTPPAGYDRKLKNTTESVVDEFKKQDAPFEPADVSDAIIYGMNEVILNGKTTKSSPGKWPLLRCLDNQAIAYAISHLHPVRSISLTGKAGQKRDMVIGVYQSDGPKEGLYDISGDSLYQLCQAYKFTLSPKDFSEIHNNLLKTAQPAERCIDRDLVPVNNGIFDYKSKQLLPFTPDKIFLTKSPINYVPSAPNPFIKNPDDNSIWDVESWIASLVDNLPDGNEVAELLWMVLGAMLRYLVPWNKAVFLISPKGNNGKGTLCELMRALVGEDSCTSISISNFGKNFMLESLLSATAIITDENDVGQYIDTAQEFKNVITGDVVQITRKYQPNISIKYCGFMVQCLNDYVNFRDKTGSMLRRQLCIPMTKCFTGAERKYIKADYVHRKEVLEYVLWRVLNMNYYELPEPDSCKRELDKSKEMNDPVLQFMNEVMYQFVWDLVPYTFLYDLYKAWYVKNVPGRQPLSRSKFLKEFKDNLNPFPMWTIRKNDDGEELETRSPGRMDKPEPLIAEYDLDNWKNSNYSGNNIKNICSPVLNAKYRGIIRTEIAESCEHDAEAEVNELLSEHTAALSQTSNRNQTPTP